MSDELIFWLIYDGFFVLVFIFAMISIRSLNKLPKPERREEPLRLIEVRKVNPIGDGTCLENKRAP